MNWIATLQTIYFIIVLGSILRVLYDTRSGTKALAYILFIVFVPIIGIIFYFSFGINYRKRKLYSKKIITDDVLRKKLEHVLLTNAENILESKAISAKHIKLAKFVGKAGKSALSESNSVKLLLNGEEKFPELFIALEAAQVHIHIEYYIYEDDATGNSIAEILIRKAKQGVEVRFLYDAFGSNSLSKKFIDKLEDAGVQTAPFYKIKLLSLASRLNYRNHRKIIVVDGVTSFIGGINISDRYRNDSLAKTDIFWRDTHLMISGPASSFLQYLFLCDWNFCHSQELLYSEFYFPKPNSYPDFGKEIVQLVPSGPDSNLPVIFYSLLEAISSAKEKILITSPYFIPGESLVDALIIAAQSGVKVQLLVPGESDSSMVNAAARSYYTELLAYKVQIFQYNKGFVHAKTMVIDSELAIVGSANMDYRSFDLNFEVNAIVYGNVIAGQLEQAFQNDLNESTLINAETWLKRAKHKHLWEKTVRLLSPFL